MRHRTKDTARLRRSLLGRPYALPAFGFVTTPLSGDSVRWKSLRDRKSVFRLAPGLTALTRMPRSARSADIVLAILTTAAFVAPYTVVPGRPMWALIEAFKTTAEPRAIRGSAFWTVKKAPFRLIVTISSNTASVTSALGTNLPMPALTQRASIHLNFSHNLAIA